MGSCFSKESTTVKSDKSSKDKGGQKKEGDDSNDRNSSTVHLKVTSADRESTAKENDEPLLPGQVAGSSSSSSSSNSIKAGGVGNQRNNESKGKGVGNSGPKARTVAPQDVLLPPHMKNATRGRRTSVSAEVLSPADRKKPYKPIVHPKTQEERARIEKTIEKNFLFASCLEEQRDEVIDAMFEKQVKQGESIITQGDEGDFFYVVDDGEFDIYVTKFGETNCVVTLGYGASFGELALMYNTPRAATVTAACDARVWGIDRVTFQRVLLESTARKRKLYEDFLGSIPLLESMTHWERASIADALVQVKYRDGDVLIKQGDEGDSFFLLEKGRCVVTKHPVDQPDAPDVQVWEYTKPGSYFGEMALLLKEERAATVLADGEVVVAKLDFDAFERMLGPVEDILKRNMSNYASYEEALAKHEEKETNKDESAIGSSSGETVQVSSHGLEDQDEISPA